MRGRSILLSTRRFWLRMRYRKSQWKFLFISEMYNSSSLPLMISLYSTPTAGYLLESSMLSFCNCIHMFGIIELPGKSWDIFVSMSGITNISDDLCSRDI